MNKYTEAMPKVRASRLYKSLCRVFRKQDHKELLRQLVWAYVDYTYLGWRFRYLGWRFRLGHADVYKAFYWEATPQRYRFWRALSGEVEKWKRS